jgi:1,4-alpha-glucan branching enzyme
MGWMHDTLAYLARDPIHRKYHHNQLTMRGLYAWSERFVLPLSHDEVVHGKGALVAKFPGDRWQQLATLRLLYAYMYSQPGKKLLFMGGEFAQEREWNHDRALDWPGNGQIQLLVGELNRLYRDTPALHELDCDPAGFRWIDPDDAARSVLTYERRARDGSAMICALNFTPVPRPNYRVGVDHPGVYRELLNTDAPAFGGSGQGNLGAVDAAPVRAHGRNLSLSITVPPLGAVWLQR